MFCKINHTTFKVRIHIHNLLKIMIVWAYPRFYPLQTSRSNHKELYNSGNSEVDYINFNASLDSYFIKIRNNESGRFWQVQTENVMPLSAFAKELVNDSDSFTLYEFSTLFLFFKWNVIEMFASTCICSVCYFIFIRASIYFLHLFILELQRANQLWIETCVPIHKQTESQKSNFYKSYIWKK